MAELAKLDVLIGADIKSLTTGLRQGEQQIEQFATKGGAAINKMSTNFTGLNRIIQDLPFGFIAISNNLEQLFPAAGALGLAVSAVTSAITFMQVGLSAWTRRTHEAKEETDKFAESLREAEVKALSTGVKLQSFADIAKDNTKTLKERNYALEQANKLMGEHGEKLTLVNINTAAATKEIENFTQALIQQAVAEKYADKAADLIIKQRDAAKALDASLKGLSAATKQYNSAIAEQTRTESFATVSTFSKDRATQNALKATQDYVDATNELREVTGDLNLSTEEATKLLSDLGTKSDIKKQTKNVEDFSKSLQGLILHLREMARATKDITTAPVSQTIQSDIFIKPLSQIEAEISIEKMRETLRAAAVKVFSNQGILSDVDLLNDDEVKKNFQKFQSHIQLLTEAAQDLGQAFGDVFQTLITQGTLSFKAVEQAIAGMISKLVSAVIEAALLSVILNALGLGSAIEGGAGFANIFKGLLGFADGGIVSGPMIAKVGESGPEAIIPLSQLTTMFSNLGTTQRIEVVGRISGQDIVLVQNKQNLRNNRNYGSNFGN